MRNISLIDADSKIPNLALMKLSSYYKAKGDNVVLYRAHLPYFPGKKKHKFFVYGTFYKIFCSVIFQGNLDFIKPPGRFWGGTQHIEFGGTGYSLSKTLPDEIENCDPDYSIYPDNDMSYGFISRGCVRSCSFCFVPKKEGKIRQVNDPLELIKHKKILYMDNNILGLPNHKEILQTLIDHNVCCTFNSGFDFRLIDEENSLLLKKLNHFTKYIFAFDSWSYRVLLEKKIKLLEWRKPWQFRFYVYVHPDMKISDTVNRLKWLKERKCLPYIMRDISCWSDKNAKFYIDLANYANNANLFIKESFDDYLTRKGKSFPRLLSRMEQDFELFHDEKL